MTKKFLHRKRVEFCETDAAGIAHFSAFVCYMEQAEHAFLRSLGISVIEELPEGGHLSWPRVKLECEYKGAARFEEELDLAVSVSSLGNKSVQYSFECFAVNPNGKSDPAPQPIMTGSITAVCCRVLPGGKLSSVAIPERIREKLTPHLR